MKRHSYEEAHVCSLKVQHTHACTFHVYEYMHAYAITHKRTYIHTGDLLSSDMPVTTTGTTCVCVAARAIAPRSSDVLSSTLYPTRHPGDINSNPILLRV
jgi:hypothetical protein